LDHFKTINDTLGHNIGDKVLIEVAERIRTFCSDTHTIARLGGDEFTIVSGEFEKEVDCKKVAGSFAQKLLQILKEPYLIEGHHLYLSASIGINSVGHKTADAKHFIKEADIAMYEAKAKGRDGIIIFNDALAQRVEHYLEIERRLYFSLEHREIELMYQPQLNAQQQLVGCEVLVRWNSPKFGLVSPSEFIHVAEKTGLIIEMGNYIIEEAFKTLKYWDTIGIHLEQFSINISVRQFFNSEFPDDIEHFVKTYLDSRLAKKVVFEVTETIFIEDIQRILDAMQRIKAFGISFSMDDFGTGYSSLSSLRDMPIGELKVDKSFVMRVGEHRSDEQMITTILTMANVFNLKTVAEGVESEAQFQFLLKNGCDIYQGFYFSKPLSKEDFEGYARRGVERKQLSSLMYEI
ncbi:MAG TPA: bifunctional diguanylate cyclase/phosphodiesterase, partial [Epsilonproteobacteria bacterium]|nr:bifunctional diguanylate cyclase/phosphodiesterase [Campylobacterota bacterium]